MKSIAGVACVLSIVPIVSAASMPVGTWVKRDSPGTTMIVEASGSGWKISLKVQAPGGQASTLVATTQGDGKDAVVFIDGKPSEQTMAIRIVDNRHTVNTLKLKGNPILIQKSEVSADGKVIRVEGSSPAAEGQKLIEIWDKR